MYWFPLTSKVGYVNIQLDLQSKTAFTTNTVSLSLDTLIICLESYNNRNAAYNIKTKTISLEPKGPICGNTRLYYCDGG